MREIDLATWNRAMHCQIFRNSVRPQYCVTFELDITNFLRRIRERGYSFTFSFVFAVTKCANEIEEFRCRFWEGKPVIYDKINTSSTYLDNGSELFKVVNVEMQDTIEEYVSLAANTVREKKECFIAPIGNDIYQFSSFPWVRGSMLNAATPFQHSNYKPCTALCGRKGESFMPCTEAYKEHIMYTLNGFCKTVIHYAAINAWRDRSRRRQKEISLILTNEELAAALLSLPEKTEKSFSFTFSGVIHNEKSGKCTDAAGVRPGIKSAGLYGSCKRKWRCFRMKIYFPLCEKDAISNNI